MDKIAFDAPTSKTHWKIWTIESLLLSTPQPSIPNASSMVELTQGL
jgi:hypothetical protein